MKMKNIVVGTALAMTVVSAGVHAQDGAKISPEMHKLGRIVGHWRGTAELAEAGKPVVKLQMRINCKRVSDNSGIMCQGKASNKQMQMAETDLFGYNTVDGHYHWFAVTNGGNVHDHVGDFTNDQTFHAYLDWRQDKMAMKENIVLKLVDKHHMMFESTTTANGKIVDVFRGKMKK